MKRGEQSNSGPFHPAIIMLISHIAFFNVGAPEIGTDVPTLSILDGSADPTLASAEDGHNGQLIIANNGNSKTTANVSQKHT